MSQIDIIGWDVIEIKTFRIIFMGVSDKMNRRGSSWYYKGSK